MVLALLALVAVVASADRPPPSTVVNAGPLVATVHPADEPVGLMVTSGGWAYCEQMRPVARRTGYTLLCGRYALDRYLSAATRSLRHLDWGEPAYLQQLAALTASTHRQVGGKLVLIGVSYSGFGVATLAAHHPELRPDRLIVLDSYYDLVARRGLLPDRHETAVEIDGEVGTTPAALAARSASAAGIARLVRAGSDLTVVWTISDDERRRFNGATCGREASAVTLARVASALERPVQGWVTRGPHGRNLWRFGSRIVGGWEPGTKVVFRPGAGIPPGSYCRT
jgi:pimeloyl-ACP methyl ester carboxylesterase